MPDDPFLDLAQAVGNGDQESSDGSTRVATSTGPTTANTSVQSQPSTTSHDTRPADSSSIPPTASNSSLNTTTNATTSVPNQDSYRAAEELSQAREEVGIQNNVIPDPNAHQKEASSSSAPFARFMRRFALLVFVGLSIYSWWYMEDTRATNILNAVLGGFIMLWAFVYWYDFRNVHGSLRGNAFLFLIAIFLMGFVNLMMALITYFHNRASEVDVARITVTVMLVCTFIVSIVLWRKMSSTTLK